MMSRWICLMTGIHLDIIISHMRFKDIFVSKEDRFSLGIDLQSGTKYLSIQVSNRMVVYEEYYAIDDALFNTLLNDPIQAKEFARKCGRRELDQLLIVKPGSDRGVY